MAETILERMPIDVCGGGTEELHEFINFFPSQLVTSNLLAAQCIDFDLDILFN